MKIHLMPGMVLLGIFSVVYAQPYSNLTKFIKKSTVHKTGAQQSKQATLSCNNWLFNNSSNSYVRVGDLDVSGTSITVEAVCNRTSVGPFSPLSEGIIITKYTSSPFGTNYALLNTRAIITTTNGMFMTPAVCTPELNKTYHVALTYNGTTLKFYRNGFLMSQIPATGSLIQNNNDAVIASILPQSVSSEYFFGYINEVRVWNTVRSQGDIRTYMNNSLPNPTTQTGLLAYYTFNNLLNKQGNPAFNGTLVGSATANITNPACTFVADSCAVSQNGISNIINDYTPVINLLPCENKIVVEDGSTFNIGDTVLLIQMKGAIIDTSNTVVFGTVTNYDNTGNYEFNYIKSKSGNIIELKNVITRQYTIPSGKVQLIRVPYYYSTSVSSTLTCLPWDGNKGGVLAFNVRDTLILNADIDISGKGFRGGSGIHNVTNTENCNQDQFFYPADPYQASEKGEGIATLSSGKVYGKGKNANGGGGGNSHNSGGAGGSNATDGGYGGYQYELGGCSGTVPFDNRGIGGQGLTYSNAINKVFLGGGAGSGQANNPALFYPKGGNGAGIAFITADYVQGNNKNIILKGENALECTSTTGTDCHEGMGGGGGGGALLFNIKQIIGAVNCNTSGGKGGDMTVGGNGRLGPGGGGSGGFIWARQASLPGAIITQSGGINGINTNNGNDAWGSTAGQNGLTLFNFKLQIDTVPFQKNIDSVRVRDSLVNCRTIDFKGFGFVRLTPIAIWQWTFGDGGTASTQNTIHPYLSSGNFLVKLVVTDANGCKDSVSKTVTITACTGISNIINSYTPVTGFLPCENKLTVEDGSTFNVGDTVLIIQMKGAVIDTSNTSGFGTVTNYGNAGNYEFNYVKSRVGNVVELKNNLTRQYTIPAGKVQLIRVPYYYSTNVSSTLTCLPWDGVKGGVLVFNVRDTLILEADVDVSGKGFRGGDVRNSKINTYTCGLSNYYYPINTIYAAGKGESISDLDSTKNAAKGAKASAGGGGLDPNTGGGGGGNGNIGGRGGYGYGDCPNYTTAQDWGLGGYSLLFNNAQNKVYLGGGGGAGHCNNGFTDPTINTNFNGGNGGGIVIITSKTIVGNTRNILSKGNIPYELTGPGFLAHDGMGGGGSGGSILITAQSYISGITANTSGARGGNMSSSTVGGRVGPGGGGGGGVLWVSQPALPPNVTSTSVGGTNGVILQDGNNPYGATAGLAGLSVFNLVIPIDTIPFQKNIDSVRIKDSLINCNTFDFKSLSFVHVAPITTWQWTFGDGATAATQNTVHQYPSATDNYLVKLVITDANGCKDSISKTVNILGANNSDFSFQFDPCTPLSIQFISNAPTPINNYWSFGDGGSVQNNQSPGHLFVAPGSYTIRYTNPSGNCLDTITKIITIGTAYQNIILTGDTTICYATSKQLFTVPSNLFCWSPATYLDNPLLANPITNTPQNSIYYFTSLVTGNNLVTNANFSQGNSSFTSAYTFTTGNSGSGQYNVAANAGTWLGTSIVCNTDHTSGTGNMLMANGSIIADTPVWSQTIAVLPNTNYELSGWLAGLNTLNPATVHFAVNGIKMGTPATAASTTCQWNRFSAIWNSGSQTSINLSIINTNTQATGNDFALDDLAFAPVFIRRDSIIINVDTPFVRTGNDTAICLKDTVRLQANGAATYSWAPAGSLSNAGINNPLAFPGVNTPYVVSGMTVNGCTARDTVNMVVKPLPVIVALTNDTTICRNASVQLNAGGGTSYAWQPANSLSNPFISNPVASPAGAVVTYSVIVTGANGCNAKDSVIVTTKPLPLFRVDPLASTCFGNEVQLHAYGGSSYQWLPSVGLSASNISNPFAYPTTGTTYSVIIRESTCNDSALLSVVVNVLPLPVLTVSKSNDIDCTNGLARLAANGANTYRWAPGNRLSDSTIANPAATPSVTTLYTVTGRGFNGCENTDTLSVFVKFDGSGMHYLPNAFTPNGDGLNECFGVKNWGQVTDLNFAIYNRWGERVFYTTNPNICWDGRYKNELQQSGNFVYIVQAKTSCGAVDMKGSILLVR